MTYENSQGTRKRVKNKLSELGETTSSLLLYMELPPYRNYSAKRLKDKLRAMIPRGKKAVLTEATKIAQHYALRCTVCKQLNPRNNTELYRVQSAAAMNKELL